MEEERQFMQHYRNWMAPECIAQMPAFNRVGRGPKGDAFDVQADVENGEVFLRGQYVDARTGEHTEDIFEINLTEQMPQLRYRMYEIWRQKDPIHPGTLSHGWYIHFEYKNMVTGEVLWNFDTPFVLIDEVPGTQTRKAIMHGSY